MSELPNNGESDKFKADPPDASPLHELVRKLWESQLSDASEEHKRLMAEAAQELEANLPATDKFVERMRKALDQYHVGQVSLSKSANDMAEALEQALRALGPEQECRRCGGSGTIQAFEGGAPEAHEIEVDCPKCKGVGVAHSAPDTGIPNWAPLQQELGDVLAAAKLLR